MLTPIQTRYAGHFFRSRLEARWAVYFDALGITWEYEKEGYDLGEAGWYLPDFWLPEFRCFVEIKGAECSDEEAAKCRALHEQSGHPVFIAEGQIGDHAWQEFGAYIIDTPVSEKSLFHMSFITGVIACPVCGNTYMSMNFAAQPVTSYPLSEAAQFAIQCENNHFGFLCFGLYKGRTVGLFREWIAREHVAPDEYWANDIAKRGGNVSHDAAIAAARSARFEHGESGAR